jgi:hypothetical protein
MSFIYFPAHRSLLKAQTEKGGDFVKIQERDIELNTDLMD